MTEPLLQNRVAVVTGVWQGIGCGIARSLSGDGATVVVADIEADAANIAAADVGGRHT